MTREFCEDLILEKLKEIWTIYKQYNPNGKYLTLNVLVDEDGEYFAFNNSCYRDGGDENIPINFWINNAVKEEVEENE